LVVSLAFLILKEGIRDHKDACAIERGYKWRKERRKKGTKTKREQMILQSKI